MISVVPMRLGDIEGFIPKAKTFDPADMRKCTDPLSTMRRAIEQSASCWSVLNENDVVVVCGVIEREDKGAYFWMLVSEDIAKCRYGFLKQTRIFFINLLKKYKYITAVVDARHGKSILWLQWLGFQFDQPFLHPDGDAVFFNVWIKGGLWQTQSA